jgi:transcription-repair coupling factor (superfamily II helicase)
MVFSIAEKLKRPFIFVVQNDAEIKNTILDLEAFTEKEVLFLPSETMKIKGVKSKDIVIDKVKVFEKILKGEMPNLVVNSDILFDKFENLWVGMQWTYKRHAVTHWMPLPEPPKEVE